MPTVTAGAVKATVTATETRTPCGMCAVARLPTWASSVSPRTGLMDGYARFLGSPASLTEGQIGWLHGTVTATVGRRPTTGGKPAEVSHDVPVPLHEREDLVSDRVLNYAVRGAD
ncbi:hypothetical protein [Streptomyces flaveolus]|uniref:hypothetical protein n=1 Tax=Streptomyces flaveolus TaxID=67297 RepID=UPI0036FF02F7